LVLILDHIQDPFNFGGIIRTAVSCGVNTIIIPKIKQTLVTNSGNFIIKIPMKHVESLNVSVATAIILYEIRNK
ncbi:uncharacterized protein LOC106159216, partial [Lingula anatina]|uniref:Uncharacterized protein LOC106159216 n=1 Tax=Lingula anatina TaxID=7574 RepID=A0A1S3HY01_LINAN